jgi:hypothetical protein
MGRTKSDNTERTPAQTKRINRHYAKKDSAAERLHHKLAAIGDDALLDEYETAAYLDNSVQTLRNWRMKGSGFPFIKIGAAVRYRVGDIKDSYQRQHAA